MAKNRSDNNVHTACIRIYDKEIFGKSDRRSVQNGYTVYVDIGEQSGTRSCYDEYLENLRIAGKRNSYSKIDTDATFMRMKEDYMKNCQLKAGYNVQIAVESEYIAGVGLFQNPTDTTTLIPFLERIRTHTGRKILNVVADAGYASEENFDYLDNNKQNAFIKPQMYEINKTKKYKNDIFRPEHMQYDSDADKYICPGGKKLKYIETKKQKTDNGYETSRKVYQCESCEGCPYRSKCHKSQSDRKIEVSHKLNKQNKKATDLITTDDGIKLRMNRSIQVEGAFGVIKQDFCFKRFLTRGKRKTEAQFFLIAFAFNIEKLCNRINSRRFGISLFDTKPA